ncbi:MAG: FprA family A-type flavoprotein [Lachnospiraceae bacterium]|jgi:flavorubredoxin|nr:FprA family A-type flavoprotein [Lachnospiraceae bacterium]
MEEIKIAEDICFIGVNDYDLDIFEGQYPVEHGVSYNSYVILDEKVAVMDTADKRVSKQWMENLKGALGERKPDYLVISHMEPDHAANIAAFAEEYPEAKLVGNAKTFGMLKQFFGTDYPERQQVVADGGELNLGKRTLHFIFAPMVHWPEVMLSFESSQGILFSADAFGKFGTLDVKEKWSIEARRYYYNIVGKYGVQVSNLLKKAEALDIQMICPLHGPVLKDNIDYYIRKYKIWASYDADKEGVLIAYASIYGNTKEAALKLAEYVRGCGEKRVVLMDLTRVDVSVALSDAFRYDHMVLAGVTYDGGLFPCMETFLEHLKAKNYQRRTVGFIENGTWAPTAAKLMRQRLEEMKGMEFVEPVVSIRSHATEENLLQLKELAKAITTR